MYTLNLEYFFFLGAELQVLERLRPDPPALQQTVQDLAYTAVGLQNFIDSQLISSELPKSKHEAEPLLKVIAETLAMWSTHEAEDWKNRLALVGETYKVFRSVLASELRDLSTLAASANALGYSSKTLLSRPEEILPPSARGVMPKSAFDDFARALECLVWEQWTAAGFHVLRATETVMIVYLENLGGTIPDEITWAKLIAKIGATRKAPPRMCSRLDHLRDHDRNELFHPGRFLDEDECHEVFDSAKNALAAMLRDLRDRSYAPPDRQDKPEP